MWFGIYYECSKQCSICVKHEHCNQCVFTTYIIYTASQSTLHWESVYPMSDINVLKVCHKYIYHGFGVFLNRSFCSPLLCDQNEPLVMPNGQVLVKLWLGFFKGMGSNVQVLKVQNREYAGANEPPKL